ncbi:MAG: hypothetical protein ACLP0J_28690 [Solirubrobacteraceae bacterium]
MGLLIYPIFVVLAFIFWALVIAAAVTLYLAAYVGVVFLTLAAMLVRSAWRPRRPRRPRAFGGRGPVPQSRYSDRR